MESNKAEKKDNPKKEYLKKAYYKKMEIMSIRHQIESWRDVAMVITPSYQKSEGHNPNRNIDKMEKAIVKMLDYEQKLEIKADAITDACKEVEACIEAIEDERYRSVLRYRYLCFYDWDEIADLMHYKKRYVLKLHGEALEMVVIPDDGGT